MEQTTIYVTEILTNYFEKGEKFKIVKFNTSRVGAINIQDIKEDGTTKRVLRGCDMFISDNVAECIERVHTDFIKRDFMKQGFDEWASIVLAHGGTLEKALETSKLMKNFI